MSRTKMIHRISVGLIAGLLFQACASQGPQTGATEPETAAGNQPDEQVSTAPLEQRPAYSSVPTKGLPPQVLNPGDCGLFLWSQTDASKFIFFRKAGDGVARMLIGDQDRRLIATDFDGDIFGQFFTEQKFESQSSGHAIDLSFSPGDELIDGARISGGRIRLTDAEGWVTTIPVLGVRACKQEPEGQDATDDR